MKSRGLILAFLFLVLAGCTSPAASDPSASKPPVTDLPAAPPPVIDTRTPPS